MVNSFVVGVVVLKSDCVVFLDAVDDFELRTYFKRALEGDVFMDRHRPYVVVVDLDVNLAKIKDLVGDRFAIHALTSHLSRLDVARVFVRSTQIPPVAVHRFIETNVVLLGGRPRRDVRVFAHLHPLRLLFVLHGSTCCQVMARPKSDRVT